MLAAGLAAWLVYGLASGRGSARALAWSDLTPRLGPVEFPRKSLRVFRDRAGLEKYLRAVMPGRAPAAPRLDFSRQEALLVAAGPRSSTGYDLQVLRVTERRHRVVVVVRELAPSLGQPVAARLTYPYRLIAIRASTKPVYVDWQGRP